MDEELQKELESLQISLEGKSKEQTELAVKAFGETFEKKVGEMNTKAKEAFDLQLKELTEKLELKMSNDIQVVKDQNTKLQEHADKLDAKMKKMKGGGELQQKSFKQVVGDALSESRDEIAKLKEKAAGKIDFSLDTKAVGDMGYAANFGPDSESHFNTDRRQQILPLKSEQTWLRNIFPGGSTDKGTVSYPRHVGGEGAVAPWDDTIVPRVPKAKIDFDFDTKDVKVQWLAGIVKIPREMLDDITFLRSFISTQLLIGPSGLYRAENDQILYGDNVAPNLDGVVPNAIAYDGAYTNGLEKIVDASFGQIAEAYHNASHIMLHPRDAVAIALNKAAGSGEYDLPPGVVGFVNGRLTIGGVPVVTTTDITKNEFLVGDVNASQFITRMSPEIRFFEQNTNDVETNMLTVRIEERAAMAIYYPEAFVKGVLTGI